ncbi:MAG: hypothetical protein ABIF88_01655 [archaeon]
MVKIYRKIILNVFLAWAFVGLFGIVLAEDSGCCTLTSDGAVCSSNILEDDCDGIFAPNLLCSSSTICDKGCCFDSVAGIYDRNVLESDCGLPGWDSDEYCSEDGHPGSKEGCCVLEDLVEYETQGKCNTHTVALGLEFVDWRNDLSFPECMTLMHATEKSACVLVGGNCKMVTAEKCLELGGDYIFPGSVGVLCTSEWAHESGSGCEMSEETTCIEGSDKVYFLDDCNNIANIYNSGKATDQEYWNEIISPENSCNPNDEDGNAKSKTCGNCNVFEGGVCSSKSIGNGNPVMGDYYCRDVRCEFGGTMYDNGDSWCAYEGVIGNGSDVVGSRHWRYVCNQGTINIEPCEDYRNEICIQYNTEEDGEIVQYNADCNKNNWRSCVAINGNEDLTQEEKIEGCEETVNCDVEDVLIGDAFSFQVCVPKYPGGFDLGNNESATEAEDLCGLATMRCDVLYRRDWLGRCKISHNGECFGSVFAEEMNEFCRKMGDCGGEVNIAGKFVKNYKLSDNTPNLSQAWIENLTNLSITIPGQYAVVENYSEYLELVGIGASHDRRRDARRAAVVAGFASSFIGDLYTNIASWQVFIAAGGLQSGSVIEHVFGGCSPGVVEFTCEVWQPPKDGEDCSFCNADPFKPCSKYRCESLGTGCRFIDDYDATEGDYLCLDSCASDLEAPDIEPYEEILTSGHKYSNVNDFGYKIQPLDGGCVDSYTSIEFGVITDEPTICRYSINEMKDFENMSTFGRNVYGTEHSMIKSFINPSHGKSSGLDVSEETEIFVRCQDSCGHIGPVDDFYEISLCVNEEDDESAPRVVRFEPESGSMVGYDSESKLIKVITNEYSYCRWDFADVSYSEMKTDFFCLDSLDHPSSQYGYVCYDNLPINESYNEFWVRCHDQPWLVGSENENEINYMDKGEKYILNRIENKIKIDWILPEEDFEIGGDTTTGEIRVKTSVGGDEHRCYYSKGVDGMKVPMPLPDETNLHKQSGFIWYPGVWEYYFKCFDEFGDVAYGNTSFEIIYDDKVPMIARIWQELGEIFIITTEPAECRYSEKSCSFSWENGTDMGSGETHVIDAIRGKKYYIKCKDDWGNVPSGCSVSVVAV